MLWLYNALCSIFWPLVWLYPPFKGSVRARLGLFPLAGYDPGAKTLKLLVNAVSAGEVVAIAPFIREVKARLPEAQIVLLTTTDSGQAMAREKLGDALALLAYFPLADLWFVSRRYLERLRPDIYVTTEAELWPNIQSQCHRRGIPVALVNARLYLHNKRGLRGWAVKKLYEMCDLILCQDERQRQNFLSFGIADSRLSVTGNTKFDFALPEWSAEQLQEWCAKWGLGDEPIIVAGSTHPGEEELLLQALLLLRGQHPSASIILAPRHIERAGEVSALAQRLGFSALTLEQQQRSGDSCDVLLVDRYGVLVDFYRLADAVVMGGTFNPKIGGHNILEATALGKAVVLGPSTFGIRAQLEMLAAESAIVQVEDKADALAQALQRLLEQPAEAARIGEAAQRVTLANRGAAKRSADSLLDLLARG